MKDGRTEGRTDGRKEGRRKERKVGRKDGRKEQTKDGWKEGGWKEVLTSSVTFSANALKSSELLFSKVRVKLTEVSLRAQYKYTLSSPKTL